MMKPAPTAPIRKSFFFGGGGICPRSKSMVMAVVQRSSPCIILHHGRTRRLSIQHRSYGAIQSVDRSTQRNAQSILRVVNFWLPALGWPDYRRCL